MCWHVPGVPATWKAEVGRLLEPRSSSLQSATVASLLYSMGDKMRPYLMKIKMMRVTEGLMVLRWVEEQLGSGTR